MAARWSHNYRWSFILSLALLLSVWTSERAPAWALTWSNLQPHAAPIARASGGTVGDLIYVLGGSSAGSPTAAVAAYDPGARSWLGKAPLSGPRFDAAEATLGNVIYLAGGSGATGAEGSLLAYNTANGTSTILGSLGTPRTRASAAIVNNRLYLVGGSSTSGATLDSIEEFNLGDNSSAPVATLPAPRQLASAIAFNNMIYIIGGLDSNGAPTDSCWVYDPALRTFSTKRPAPVAVTGKSAIVANNKIYLVGGATSSGPPNTWSPVVQEYDPATDSWRIMGTMLTSRFAAVAAVANNTLYVIGGDNGLLAANELANTESASLVELPGLTKSWPDSMTPATSVDGLEGIIAIAEGDAHKVALKYDGTVLTWGANGSGQLGYEGLYDLPHAIPGVTGARTIAAGLAHTSVLFDDGTVREYGNFYWPEPRVLEATGFTALSGGDYHTLFLKGDGTVWSLGVFDEAPIRVTGLNNVIAVAAGTAYFTTQAADLALTAEGTVWAWDTEGLNPYRIPNLSEIIAIASGDTCAALKADGTVWQWLPGASPVQVSGLSSITSITASTALTADGSAVWDFSNVSAPVQIGAVSNVSAITKTMALIPYSATTILTSTLPFGITGTAYSQQITLSGGTTPYSCTVTPGELPPGLGIDSSTCTIAGTPTTAGTFNLTLTARDRNLVAASQAFTIVVYDQPQIATTALPNGLIGVPYQQTVQAVGGNAPYHWAVIAGSLPNGITLNGATGELTGTPSLFQAPSFTVQVTDANGVSGSRQFSLAVVYPAMTIVTDSLPSTIVNTPYQQTLTVYGGTDPYVWSIASGALPTGLTLNSSSGLISGTPTQSQTATFTVKVTDIDQQTATRTLTITIAELIRVPELPPGAYPTVQSAYNAAPSGGTIELHDQNYTEDLICDRAITVTLRGGYDTAFASNPGYSTLQGTVSINSGTVLMDRIIIR